MLQEAKQVGSYQNELTQQTFDRLQIVTIQEILDGKRLALPLLWKCLKKQREKML
ncbi:MAG: hypothetical protein NZ551_00435 [Microscillaceae bacterium]|nr:hypothetical protein [Microscillaceae bacterium]MDW8459656.1 hypothetical protein [Cytophagales bacterium]